MSKNKDEAIKCLNALGDAWRHDWSDFDGRTLRGQLSEIAQVLDGCKTFQEFIDENEIIDKGGYFWWKY